MQATMTEKARRKQLAKEAGPGRELWLFSGGWNLDHVSEVRGYAMKRYQWAMESNTEHSRRFWMRSYFEWKKLAFESAKYFNGHSLPLP